MKDQMREGVVGFVLKEVRSLSIYACSIRDANLSIFPLTSAEENTRDCKFREKKESLEQDKMVNPFVEGRKLLFRWNFVWAIFAGVCGGLVVDFAIRKTDKFPVLGYLPLLLAGHYGVSLIIVFWRGRWWGEVFYGYALEWWGMNILQVLGFGLSVAISYLMALFEFDPYHVLALCGYSACMSQFLNFIVRLDITSAWISTTAYVAIVQGDPKPPGYVRDAIIVCIVLLVITTLRNYLDDLVPDHDLEVQGKASQICDHDPPPQRTRPLRHRGPPCAVPAGLLNDNNV